MKTIILLYSLISYDISGTEINSYVIDYDLTAQDCAMELVKHGDDNLLACIPSVIIQ